MAKRNTSIKINGQHYDALTGVLLTDISAAPKQPVVKSIDGVVGKQPKHTPAPTIIKPEPLEVRAPKAAAVRTPAAHAKAHYTKSSATLMRHAVAKPQAQSLKRHVKVQSSTLSTTQAHHPVKVNTKLSVYGLNHQRAARAAQVSLSPKIARFAQEVVSATPVAVEQALSALNKAIVIPQTITASPVYRPDVMPARTRKTASSDIFEQALLRATSHEQPAPIIAGNKKNRRAARSLRRRMISYSAGAVAVLALAGFLGVQHADTIQFKVATNKAGFSATMPDYKPIGFVVDSVRSYNGYVGVKYVADTIEGNRSFAITEKPSSWNSNTLLTNIQANGEDTAYQTIEKAGRTVYVYGNNQAAWVNNGILYQLAGNGALAVHEIGQIAASM
ncbi:MAG: hypothetical protein JWN82_244 [Candidatus Saccharibacteria bacterium]|nr:hypothetical protein [Candidatus Saccharibacteria bacterium]